MEYLPSDEQGGVRHEPHPTGMSDVQRVGKSYG